MSPQRLDLRNKRFGYLTVVEPVGVNVHGKWTWNCRCDCGAEAVLIGSKIISGHTRSCGCLRVETMGDTMTTHGLRATPEYNSWAGMIQRCTNSHCKCFDYYGGRGIGVCERWLESFAAFYSDMGPRPSMSHTLDRYPDNDGDYSPDNCRWATKKEQAANRRPYGSKSNGV